jgi:hypothetical protein
MGFSKKGAFIAWSILPPVERTRQARASSGRHQYITARKICEGRLVAVVSV